jgi:outer membrane protein W
MSAMKTIGSLLTSILCLASTARAQDAPKIGLTMGYPASIGVLWQMNGRVAVRPEIGVSHASGDTSGIDITIPTPLTTDSTNTISTGLSALFYFGPNDALRTYVSPRFSYGRMTTSAASGTSTSDTTLSTYQLTGSFGAQYTLGRRFGVFGEIGLGYTRTNTDISSTVTITTSSISNGVLTQIIRTQAVTSGSHSNLVSTRSGAGVIFFF